MEGELARASAEILTSDNFPLPEVTKSLPADDPLARLLRASLAANTLRAYAADLRHFRNWGGSIPSSPETLARYVADHAEKLAVATVVRRVVSVGKAHSMRGYENPAKSELVRLALRGFRRLYGKPQRQVAPAVRQEVLAMVKGLGGSLRDLRDRALILVGFAGAFRRSELREITCTDLAWKTEGVLITVPRSKTDQEGRGRKVAIPGTSGPDCPVRALKSWLDASGIIKGPVFRPVNQWGKVGSAALSGEAVATVVKARAREAGLNEALYSGHSLRAGFVTSAARAGVPVWKIRVQTGHASDAMVGRYVREKHPFRDSAAKWIDPP